MGPRAMEELQQAGRNCDPKHWGGGGNHREYSSPDLENYSFNSDTVGTNKIASGECAWCLGRGRETETLESSC